MFELNEDVLLMSWLITVSCKIHVVLNLKLHDYQQVSVWPMCIYIHAILKMCEFYIYKKPVLPTNISQVIYIIDLSWYM
jgi:hypothetical protein